MRAFTLIELLVVISIISALLAITVPALNHVRRQARALLSMRNQREVSTGLNLYAMDHDDVYPQSVATVGYEDRWNWSEPTRMIGNKRRSPQLYRSMSAYLRDYIPNAELMFCPNAPQKYLYLKEAWNAGDSWDNPDTPMSSDPLSGTFCFFWNYTGYLGEGPRLFRGPRTPASMGSQSRLVITDYFGYDSWRTPGAYASCERLPGASVEPETQLTAALWKVQADPNAPMPNIKLRAAYTDGHVETYSPADTVPMRVPVEPEGVPPYPDGGASPGIFYIPRNALH